MEQQQHPTQSRPHRQVHTQFEPSRLAQQSLAEVYARLVPLLRRPLGERSAPAGTVPGAGAPQERSERREGQQCS